MHCGEEIGQWEYRVFEKPIIVLIIVDFTSVYRVLSIVYYLSCIIYRVLSWILPVSIVFLGRLSGSR